MARIYLAGDHAGYELKEALIPFLRERGHTIEDLGPSTFDPGDDYPDYLLLLGTRVAGDPGSFGIGIGGSGQGEAMAANRIKGVRAAVYYGGTEEVVKKSREHNNANILCLGARFVTVEEAKRAVELWIKTPFEPDERHARRIAKLGFTLIEMLVAIAVLVLLAGIVVVSISGSKESAQDAIRKTDMQALALAMRLFKDDRGLYPASPLDTQVVNMNTGDSDITPYVSTIPTDPVRTGSNGYRYAANTARTGYTLLVKLESNNDAWCSINVGGGYALWNGVSGDGGGTNYPPCTFDIQY